MSPLVCSALGTMGTRLGAFGVRTRRATLVAIVPSRARKRNSERTTASFRRVETGSKPRSYSDPSHSRRSSAVIEAGAGG